MKTASICSNFVGLQGGGGSRGFVLLDAVIAILIFSIGILGMVALQGTAVALAGDAQYRSNAAMLADQVIAQMWGDFNASESVPGTKLKTDFSTGGASYNAWVKTIGCGTASSSTSCLPGVTAGGATNQPSITVDNSTSTAANPNSLVTVTIFWQSPSKNSNATAGGVHSYVTTTQIAR
jgi:type IV pilus assembly protein PilV